jgi:hypothetical protein
MSDTESLAVLSFKISIENEICTFELKDRSAVKYLKNKAPTKQIDEEKKKIIFSVAFTEDEFHLYNQLLDNADVSITELTQAIKAAHRYFTDYEVSRKTQNFIDKYINSLGRAENTWRGLTEKPDYNLCLYKNRMLPYFHIECKDWVKANLEAMKGDYPTEIIRASTKITVNGINNPGRKDDEFTDELNMATKNNNFLEWGILAVNKYPDMERLVDRILTFHQLGLKKQALTMFLKLLLSPKECHIIKEPAMWNIFKPQMAESNDINEIVKYCCCYAMYILRHEETVMFSQVNVKYRVLFTLEQAANMPIFSNSHMERDPYILQLTDDSRLNDCITFYVRDGRKINNKQEFNRRFHLASGGAFKNVDLRSLGAAITGSILIPCVHTSPLEKGFEDVDWVREREGIKTPHSFMVDTPETPEDYAFLNYLEYYYPSYVSLTDADYQKQVLKIDKQDTQPPIESKSDINYETDDVNNIGLTDVNTNNSTNVNTLNSTVELSSVETNLPKTERKNINQPPIIVDSRLNAMETENKSIKPSIDYNQLADIDISITTRDFDTFKTNALLLYEAIKKNCEHRGDVYIKEIKTLASIKYKIFGPGIPRPMDIFRIPYDPVKMVKKFHVHAVKMFYDNEVTLFRSCVACLLSGVGESYKWFSCNKIAADVLLKYAQRGFSIILNKKERDAMSKYMMDNERWGRMLKYLNVESDKIYCCVTADHPFFKPGLYDSGIRMTLRNFERDSNGQYASNLVVSYSKSLFNYGDLRIKDNNKMYAPNTTLINACLDYIENESAEEEEN